MWLDSGGDARGRYDIFVTEPLTTIVSTAGKTFVECGNERNLSTDDPLAVVRHELARYPCSSDGRFPFTGGAVGYFAYGLGRYYETIPSCACDDLKLPDLAVGIYGWALVVDHKQQESHLIGHTSIPEVICSWKQQIHRFTRLSTTDGRGAPLRRSSRIESNLGRSEYAAHFARIQNHLRNGECYQINFAQRFRCGITGHSWTGFCRLMEIGAAPYAAYLNLPFCQILSASPERFLQVKERRVITSPIKGTRPRCPVVQTDQRLGEELRTSGKDRAENLMIVDLLRNDLGKACRTGSIEVPELFVLQSFSAVHHLISTIRGELADRSDALDLMRVCFPGGSITGAPKIQAMHIIDELEPHQRSIYSGSIGYIGFDGNMDSNIAIRTIVIKSGNAYYWSGGGIVIDSECDAEYQETFDKARGFFMLFDTTDNHSTPRTPG